MHVIACPNCQALIQNTPQLAGKNVRCYKCNSAFPLPPLPPGSIVSPFPSPRRLRKKNRAIPVFAGVISIASLVAILIAIVNGKKPQDQNNANKPKPIEAKNQQANRPIIAKPGLLGALPAGINQTHAKMLRQYLSDNLPDGKWDEIEWTTREIKPEETTSSNELWAKLSGFADNKEVTFKPGVRTTLKIRAKNRLGALDVGKVGIIQRGENDWSFMGLNDESYIPFDPN
jgi:hypothetical protein